MGLKRYFRWRKRTVQWQGLCKVSIYHFFKLEEKFVGYGITAILPVMKTQYSRLNMYRINSSCWNIYFFTTGTRYQFSAYATAKLIYLLNITNIRAYVMVSQTFHVAINWIRLLCQQRVSRTCDCVLEPNLIKLNL